LSTKPKEPTVTTTTTTTTTGLTTITSTEGLPPQYLHQLQYLTGLVQQGKTLDGKQQQLLNALRVQFARANQRKLGGILPRRIALKDMLFGNNLVPSEVLEKIEIKRKKLSATKLTQTPGNTMTTNSTFLSTSKT